MKIHSINFRKNENFPNESFTPKSIVQSNNNNNEITVKPIDLDKLIPLNKDKDKDKTKSKKKQRKKENTNKNNNNNKNSDNIKDIDNEQEVVPQKILKFNKKSLSLKKKEINEKNINHYQNALLDKLQLVVTNSNHPKINKKMQKIQKVNNEGVQICLSPIGKTNSLFNNYRDYQKEFFSPVYNVNINYQPNNKLNKIKSSSYTPINDSKLLIKNKNRNLNNGFAARSVSNILQRKFHGELPIFLNSPVTFMKNFKSYSEKERDERNSHALLRLRDFLDIYWDKRIELVSEFFSTYQISKNEYYTLRNLENFANYIYDNINDDTNVTKGIIETRIPMKEIIDKGIKYNHYSLKKLKNSKSLSKLDSNKFSKKNKTSSNWYKSKNIVNNNSKNDIKMSNFRKSRTFLRSNEDINSNSCFYIDNYLNNEYEISDREIDDKIEMNEKIEKYRKYLNKNYGANVINKFMRKYNQEEKDIFFNKRKVGTIDISDKDNLVNNINKQSNFYKLKSTNLSIRKNQAIHNFSEKDFKELFNELKEAKQSYLNENKDEIKNNEENIWIKMYEDVKRHKFEKHPELVLKKKKKLLEYIIFQNIKERKEFEKDLLK